jgi:hypothetical protein
MITTAHADIRCQHRGIPFLLLDLLPEFGHRQHDHAGAKIVFSTVGQKTHRALRRRPDSQGSRVSR